MLLSPIKIRCKVAFFIYFVTIYNFYQFGFDFFDTLFSRRYRLKYYGIRSINRFMRKRI